MTFILIYLAFVIPLIRTVFAVNCPAYSTIPNGDVTYLQINPSSLYQQGSTAFLICKAGYIASGNTISTCSASGSWTPTLGACQSIATYGQRCTPLSVDNGLVTYLQASLTDQYMSGTIALLTCNLGYIPEGSTSATCQTNIWSTTLGTCKSLSGTSTGLSTTCPALSSITNGQILYLQSSLTTPYCVGTSATLVCDLGFLPHNATVSRCTSSGTWDPPIGKCVRIGGSTAYDDCADVGTVANGNVVYDLIYPRRVGTAALLFCNLGYLPSGTTILTCTQSGTWSGTLGSCQSTSLAATTTGECPALTKPNGVVSYDLFRPRAKGTTATLLCNLGYVVSGAVVSVCGDLGIWSPTLGDCKSVSYDPGTLTNTNTGVATGTGTGTDTSTVTQCQPIDVQNGFTVYDLFNPRTPNTAASLICYLGYVPIGTTVVICNSDGTWSGTMGTCVSFV